MRCFFGRSAGGYLVILALRTVRFGRFGGPSPGTSGSGGTGRFLPRRRRGSQNGLFSRNWQRRRAVFAAIGTLTSVGTLTVFPRSGRFRVPVRVFGRFFAAIGTLTSFVRYSYLVICLVIYAWSYAGVPAILILSHMLGSVHAHVPWMPAIPILLSLGQVLGVASPGVRTSNSAGAAKCWGWLWGEGRIRATWGWISADRGSKATLPLTMPRRVFKSSAKDSAHRP